MEMHFQNFRKAEPWVAFSLYRICNRWFKPCLSDVYRFCLLFLKNCDEWIKYKVNFVISWIARLDFFFLNIFLSDKFKFIRFFKAVSAYFHDIVKLKTLCQPINGKSSLSLSCFIRVFCVHYYVVLQ